MNDLNNPQHSEDAGQIDSRSYPIRSVNRTYNHPVSRFQQEGGDIDKNDPEGRNGQGQAANKRAARERQQKPKKIKRYESNSIDEEEFQDYFTNPIKRKEFDRQRKKQQMREMHNITGFTLGQFGIKSMKALKEAMPAYPDEDDAYGINDASKNYATVSLCCLSVTNPFRNKIIQLVAVNPWFDRLILVVIMINCVFLALDMEVDAVTDNSVTIDFVFLQIYTLEMILKIIAMGFFMRAHSYLRDSWNILDFMVVIMGWVSRFMDGSDVSAIKVIRILRPLRTINQIPNMSSLVSTILNSLPIMFDVMVLFFFMLIMFGTIATQLIGGELQKRCVLLDVDGETVLYQKLENVHPNHPEPKPVIVLGREQVTIICQEQSDCDKVWDEKEQTGTPFPLKSKCMYYGDPIMGTFSFDNILLSIMNIFQMITLEGWTDMMYIVRDATNTYAYDSFFVACVVLGSFVILNLMIAVQASYLDQAFDEEDNRQKELKDKLEHKKRIKMEQEEEEEDFDDEYDMDNENQDGNEDEPDNEGLSDDLDNVEGDRNARRSSKNKNAEQKSKGCCNFKAPQWYIDASAKVKKVCDNPIFEKSVIILILLNTVFLASEHYDQPEWLDVVQNAGNLFFTFIFAIEMIVKMFGYGIKLYISDGFNIFDCFIVIMSFVEMSLPGQDSSLSVLRAFRLLRIFKIIKSWDSLRLLLSTVLSSLTAITNLGVLIALFLFISALLTKQFFSEDLYGSDGEVSRYNFGSTGDALITIFIILTGENWNQIMVEVIDKKKDYTVSVFFISLMMIGNFMLLNLFLAILLKSISEIGNKEKEEETDKKDENPEEASNKEDGEGAEQDQLNSSNSNIEEEFDQIKKQLMALSNNMNALLDGTLAVGKKDIDKREGDDGDAHNEVKVGALKGPRGNDQAGKSNFNDNQSQGLNDEDQQPQGKSLYIFAYNNPLRKFLRNVIANQYFANFIYHMIAINSLLLALDEPFLTDPYQKQTLHLMLNIISIIFVVEAAVRIIVRGFYQGEDTYLKDPFNILDFLIVIFSILTWVLEATVKDADISFIRGFRALRALRPLRVVSKNEGIKTVVNSLLESIPALLNVLLIVLLFLLVFGILGIQLFKGMLGACNDQWDETITTKQECLGKGTFMLNTTQWDDQNRLKAEPLPVETKTEWNVPINNYDDIFHSMLTFFEISTLEMWPDMMFNAVDSVAYDHVGIHQHRPPIALLYVIYIFFTTFFIMNLFISVIVDKFNDEIKKRQGSDNFTEEQKEWVKIQRLLVHTKPKIIPVEPINCFRLQCFKIVQSQAFEYVVMTAIIINTIFLCIDYHGKPPQLVTLLYQANLSFVAFFTIELALKITAYGFKYYWYVNWNKFDFTIVLLSLVALEEKLLTQMNFNVTALRIIRVSRLLRMVKTSEGLRTLLKTLFMSLGNIINTAALLLLILFTFSVAGMSLFGSMAEGEAIDKNTNFKTFYQSVMALARASTGESWNAIMHACLEDQGPIAIVYWLLFQLIAFFIFMNVFIAVIGESFNDNQATEDENDILALKKKDIKAFQNTWAKYNPMGELYMRTIRLPDFLRELPPPLGYQGIRIEESKLNKIIFCLNIRDHLGRVYYPEVMWTIFHSIAGMNDEKVLNCEQIANILKIVKNKYKGLGKKVNLDSLCGNKYYRKELTAIKYIQAMKILTKWRLFKQAKLKMKDQNNMKHPDDHGHGKQPPRGPSNHGDGGGAGGGGHGDDGGDGGASRQNVNEKRLRGLAEAKARKAANEGDGGDGGRGAGYQGGEDGPGAGGGRGHLEDDSDGGGDPASGRNGRGNGGDAGDFDDIRGAGSARRGAGNGNREQPGARAGDRAAQGSRGGGGGSRGGTGGRQGGGRSKSGRAAGRS